MAKDLAIGLADFLENDIESEKMHKLKNVAI